MAKFRAVVPTLAVYHYSYIYIFTTSIYIYHQYIYILACLIRLRRILIICLTALWLQLRGSDMNYELSRNALLVIA